MENNKNHILIVDDDDRIRDLLKDYLTENSYVVTTAENASQAKDKLNYFKFDIIILDVMMPGQNGYELTQVILDSFFGKFLIIALCWTFSFHILNELRHLFWDLGYGFDLKISNITGLCVIFGSFISTVLIYFIGRGVI